MPESISTSVIIDASPTKELFIEMLTRDVPLLWAILDVVDNSVDAAKAQAGERGLTEFEILIDTRKDFEIHDNCGGLLRKDAISHAFRFGRDTKNPATPYSVGQFGVGMKRTLFKMGNDFCVDSNTGSDSFRVCVNVPSWRDQTGWDFGITETPPLEVLSHPGLRIRVWNLHDVVARNLSDPTFVNELRDEIQRSHFTSIEKGLNIRVNDIQLSVPDLGLKSSATITPFHKKLVYHGSADEEVQAEVWAGMSTRDPELAGWYIFCNERMVLAHDQTASTGWGENGGRVVPKFHNDFAFFRGYVMFRSRDPKLLPWTSMKTGVDEDSKVYIWAKEEMISGMRLIIKALRDLAKEKSTRKVSGLSEGALESSIESSSAVPFMTIAIESPFVAPEPELPDELVETESVLNILYQRPREQVEKVKASLGVRSASAAGEKTFDYYVKYGM